jgi:hypothetical protein
MDTTSVAYVLCRIEDDSSLTPVSQHGDFLTGIAAGGHAVEVEDLEFAYALYAGDTSNGSSTRVASFREGSLSRGPLEASSTRVAMTITAVAMATTIRAVQVRWAA